MEIFGGCLNDAISAPVSEWDRYPYRRSESRESFSQALFRLLALPEATNEVSGTITIHQLLRLMYADQLSPVGTLFKFERFDPPLLRDSVGRLVFGAYDNELYANERRVRELRDQFASVSSELSAISKLMSQSGEVLTSSWLSAERDRVEKERLALDAEIAKTESLLYESGKVESISLQDQRDAYKEVQVAQKQLADLTSHIDACKFEIADAGSFIRDLENKLVALNESSLTSNAFGKIAFQYCPACTRLLKQIILHTLAISAKVLLTASVRVLALCH